MCKCTFLLNYHVTCNDSVWPWLCLELFGGAKTVTRKKKILKCKLLNITFCLLNCCIKNGIFTILQLANVSAVFICGQKCKHVGLNSLCIWNSTHFYWEGGCVERVGFVSRCFWKSPSVGQVTWVNLSQSHVRSQLSPICCYCSFEHEGIPLAPRSKHRNNKLQSKSDRETLCLLHLGRSFEEMLRET